MEFTMATIQLRTPIPGPKSQALSARRAKAVPRGLSHGTPIYVATAEDAWLEDVDGNRYLDFAGGIGCANAGHRRHEVVDAVKDQLDHFLHTCVQVTPYENYVRLAERMNEVTPGKFAKKTIFVNSGAEAVENAVKIARAYSKRSGIIAFEDAAEMENRDALCFELARQFAQPAVRSAEDRLIAEGHVRSLEFPDAGRDPTCLTTEIGKGTTFTLECPLKS